MWPVSTFSLISVDTVYALSRGGDLLVWGTLAGTGKRPEAFCPREFYLWDKLMHAR